MTTVEIIDALDLQPHPEGGFYRETYRSKEVIPYDALLSYPSDRNQSTAIYFLLTKGNYSAFHRVRQDELWHFHQGGTIVLHLLSPEGVHAKVCIGNDILHGEHPQFTVPGGYWFAGTIADDADHSLVSCTVAPGFDFADFELADTHLIDLFPEHTDLIQQFLPAI